MRKKILPGLNIQYPISRLIADGTKTVETRTYPLPTQYLNQDLFLIETPGKTGNFSARIIGTIRFSENIKYKSKNDFYKDISKHRVDRSSPWSWQEKPKWGWKIEKIFIFDTPAQAPKKRGIVFTKSIALKQQPLSHR